MDDWLYEAHPVSGCTTCTTAKRKLDVAKKTGNASARFEAARVIRAHATHGAKG
ncbi:hypothetical protein AB0D13_09035 [Streptomyces sp. NPDC048430]|uniref:hypothetical protein n=1 Tax=Streptomyces sp. NPDC048430 TaxID=3155388 RepID=UPI0034163F61